MEERSTARWLLVVVMMAMAAPRVVFVGGGGGGDHSRVPAAAAMVSERVAGKFVKGCSARFAAIREEGAPVMLTSNSILSSRSRFDTLAYFYDAHSLFAVGFSTATAAPVVPILEERRKTSREEVWEASMMSIYFPVPI